MSTTRSRSRPAPATEGAALLLVGLGSSREGGADPLFAHAAELRRRGLFAETAVGLLTGAPGLAEPLRRLSTRIVYVVPFFMSDGYLAREKLPRLLRALAVPGQELRVCRPIGTDPRLTPLLEARAVAACVAAGLDPAEASLVVAAHGTPASPASAEAAKAHVRRLAAGGRFRSVRPGFLQEAPFLADVLRAGDAPTIVVGLFAGPGLHAGEDVPRLVAEARRSVALPILDAGPIGTDPGCADLIAAAAEAARTEW